MKMILKNLMKAIHRKDKHPMNRVKAVYHFPQLHKGSCFYDLLSRYHGQSAHLNCRATSMELFGSVPDLRPSVTLPYRAELIYTWLGPSSNISLERLRDHHSAWQYLQLGGQYGEEELAPVIRAYSKPGQRKQARMMASVQGSLTHLRYCPLCLIKDTITVNEPYWHQLHQVYGVRYCPVHKVRLVESSISLKKRLLRYIPASSLLSEPGMEEIITAAESSRESNERFKEKYIALAETINWLLENGLALKKDALRQRYCQYIGIDKDNPSLSVKIASFLREVYGEAFLQDIFPDISPAGSSDAKQANISESLLHALIITGMGGTEWLSNYST